MNKEYMQKTSVFSRWKVKTKTTTTTTYFCKVDQDDFSQAFILSGYKCCNLIRLHGPKRIPTMALVLTKPNVLTNPKHQSCQQPESKTAIMYGKKIRSRRNFKHSD